MLAYGREYYWPHSQRNLLRCFTIKEEIGRNEKGMMMVKT
jgi:hypothetical protein